MVEINKIPITVLLDRDIYEYIEKEAKKNDRKKAYVINGMLRYYIDTSDVEV